MFSIKYLDDFEYSKISKNIYSTFYVECKEVAYPDNQWTDFPVAVLSMWCENIISKSNISIYNKFELFFMDGPFSIECERNADKLIMKFINTRKKGKTHDENIVSYYNVVNEIYEASVGLIKKLEKTEFKPINDMDKLKGLVKKWMCFKVV
ncbi:hypothetical protein RBH29_17305 [Herbivorax sp. ANBcel31]|uniref:hypothetical protein n=1 Tax=Herbivorax sp. ANBcel31 TaxID=3069754 RepID=UPI0027B5BB3B|nr:hypothetical protein [Herbivorax sp. ANBcel31]MDQ2088183.1 hypothetical protein [Herbivorax sp. ANBcel31]